MQADYSVELGRDDPALELPWTAQAPAVELSCSSQAPAIELPCSSQTPAVELPWSSQVPAMRYYDLKKHPEIIAQLPEVVAYPELGAFLTRINAPGFPLQTAKCDAWSSRDILPEEEIFGAEYKFVSYVDLVFTDREHQSSFEKYEELARNLCRLLQRVPDLPASVEFVIRRCYYHDEGESDRGEGRGSSKGEGGGDEGWRGSSEGEGGRDEGWCGSGKGEGGGDEGWRGSGKDRGLEGEHSSESDRGEQDILRDEGECGQSKSCAEGSLRRYDKDMLRATDDLDARDSRSGFYLTAYASGFGNSIDEAAKRWAITLTLVRHALVQTATTRP
jgi:hypothetical protein